MATSNDSTTYVGGYNATAASNVPPDSGATGKRFQGAAEIRQVKKVLKDTFSAITGAVTASHTEINQLDGVTVGGTTAGDIVTIDDTQTLTNKTLTAPTFTGYMETVYALGTSGSLALDPGNGNIQTCALTGDPTFTDSLAAGESLVLMLTNGATYTITWPTITWVTSDGDTEPAWTANDVVVMWKVGSTLYGAYVGSGV